MKIIITTIFLCVIFLQLTSHISAHTRTLTEGINIVMHIDPDDDPIVNKQATFTIQFSDEKKQFKLSDCHCVASISNENKTIYAKTLINKSENEGTFTFTFPEGGIYSVQIAAYPKTEETFQYFTYTTDIQVNRPLTKAENNRWRYIPAITVVSLIFFFFVISKYNKR